MTWNFILVFYYFFKKLMVDLTKKQWTRITYSYISNNNLLQYFVIYFFFCFNLYIWIINDELLMCNWTKILIVTIMFVAISVYFIISYYVVKLYYHVKHELFLSKNIIIVFFFLCYCYIVKLILTMRLY